MENSPLLELMTDQLRDLYDAEKQLTKALPKLAKASADAELKEAFTKHLGETQEQVRRIEEIFGQLGKKIRGKPCAAMKGLVEEGQEVISGDLDKSVRDIALVAAARRVEHYEMAAYDSLMSAVQVAKQSEVLALLKETAGEEATADKLLSAIGKRLLKEATRTVMKPAAAAASNGHLSNTTTDHDEIRQWAEERGGKPSCVQGTGAKGDIGLMRIEFPGKPNANDDNVEEISWEDFFAKFDERGLALVYQTKTAAGKKSNFNKIIAREEGGSNKTKSAGR